MHNIYSDVSTVDFQSQFINIFFFTSFHLKSFGGKIFGGKAVLCKGSQFPTRKVTTPRRSREIKNA